ncbi:MAG: hypothetical protein JWN85_243 [Gammaproteobacteria bacterium]|nr:hypothetical protein [Gammaproteobacteria bacterium]
MQAGTVRAQNARVTDESWPELPLELWRETCATLHMWTQIVGKICLALTPRVNHFWNVTLLVTSRGLSTPALPYGGRTFNMTFDFLEHQLLTRCSDGASRNIPLSARSVAEFYRDTMRMLHELGIDVKIWTLPVEVPDPIRFELDTVHASYEAAYAHRFWQILLQASRVMQGFRAGFVGKCSPVHFFWGSFDLAVTRFSGRPAPERPGADPITREAYSHEVISHGFWPGSGATPYAAFYAYAAPEPAGFKDARVLPASAFYSPEVSEFILPYEKMRAEEDPAKALEGFMKTTYEAGARLAKWDRQSLERPASS